jgi:hypothetical protein
MFCRFCHASYTNKPERIKKIDALEEEALKLVKESGYGELGLASLSSGDYPGIVDLSKKLSAKLKSTHIKISLPSLRADSMTPELAKVIQENYRSGLHAVSAGFAIRLEVSWGHNTTNTKDLIVESHFFTDFLETSYHIKPCPLDASATDTTFEAIWAWQSLFAAPINYWGGDGVDGGVSAQEWRRVGDNLLKQLLLLDAKVAKFGNYWYITNFFLYSLGYFHHGIMGVAQHPFGSHIGAAQIELYSFHTCIGR